MKHKTQAAVHTCYGTTLCITCKVQIIQTLVYKCLSSGMFYFVRGLVKVEIPPPLNQSASFVISVFNCKLMHADTAYYRKSNSVRIQHNNI